MNESLPSIKDLPSFLPSSPAIFGTLVEDLLASCVFFDCCNYDYYDYYSYYYNYYNNILLLLLLLLLPLLLLASCFLLLASPYSIFHLPSSIFSLCSSFLLLPSSRFFNIITKITQNTAHSTNLIPSGQR